MFEAAGHEHWWSQRRVSDWEIRRDGHGGYRLTAPNGVTIPFADRAGLKAAVGLILSDVTYAEAGIDVLDRLDDVFDRLEGEGA